MERCFAVKGFNINWCGLSPLLVVGPWDHLKAKRKYGLGVDQVKLDSVLNNGPR
jgi:hypothetical protein